jgi:hypothetical protein
VNAQLAALDSIHGRLAAAGIDYRLFGGWAVDFHAGSVSREHDDIERSGALSPSSARFARIIELGALKADKSEAHGDRLVAAKDRADLATLARAGR